MNKLSLIIILFLLGCDSKDIKFEKTGWVEREDLGIYPHRNKMLNDLTQNYKLKGLSHKQLIDLIGKPEQNLTGEKNYIYYNIITEYKGNIDPIYVKNLEVKLTKDSTVESFRINENER
jgi:hypothetical protein